MTSKEGALDALAQVAWLLDPDNTSVTLTTLERAAAALDRKLRVEFIKN